MPQKISDYRDESLDPQKMAESRPGSTIESKVRDFLANDDPPPTMVRRVILSLIVLLPLLFSCSSKPALVETSDVRPEELFVIETPPEEPAVAETYTEKPPGEADFDPLSISQEVFDSTKSDVQKLILDLNRIIKAKDYDTWVSYLGKAYLDKISSGEFLASVSGQPYLKNKKITLTSAKDYFEKVVVPSRANDRVDDIAFVSPNRVKVYTFNENRERLRLYELEYFGGGWKIIN
jgi:hypothetical protein